MTVVGDTTNNEQANKPVDPAVNAASPAENNTSEKQGVLDDLKTPTQAPTGPGTEDVEELSRIPGRTSNTPEDNVTINGTKFTQDELIITPEEKLDFIDAMITGERYKQKYDLFGGKIHVVIRSRTAEETHALYAYIRYSLSDKNGEINKLSRLEGDMSYVPLVAQIAEINGVSYPEMKAPLTFEESEGKLVEPGWYEDFKAWKKKPEGLTSALINTIQLFEYKYWTMVKEASNKNFWNPDTSID